MKTVELKVYINEFAWFENLKNRLNTRTGFYHKSNTSSYMMQKTNLYAQYVFKLLKSFKFREYFTFQRYLRIIIILSSSTYLEEMMIIIRLQRFSWSWYVFDETKNSLFGCASVEILRNYQTYLRKIKNKFYFS